ncbi:cupin domain-containing protein [Dactylosporangium sp. NPDC048998]|uniref:cupin domain-containing protein n=1 Tax=Dactylosporangium sp. NPDC048998 TaxID=3363976 RepID=UPI00371EACC8
MRAADTAPVPLGEVGVQRILLGAPRSDGSPLLMGVTQVRAGQTSPLIQHDTAEVAYVLAGSGWMVTDSSEHPFAPGDAILIEAGCWHAIRAGEAPVEMLYAFPAPEAPATRTYRSTQP